MTSFRRAFCAAILIAASSTVLTRALQRGTEDSRSETVGGKRVVAREVLVKFRSVPDLASIHAALDVDADEIVGRAGVRRVHSRAHGTAALIAALERRGDVEYVEPNYIVHTTLLPNDTYFPLMWGLQNTGQSVLGSAGVPGADISAPAAWNLTTGSRANVVAVIDTGVDYTHPDLSGNMWSAPTAFSVVIGGITITCAAGTHGFNAVTNTCDPMDDNNHGTHVAGTIGAIGNNAAGVVGVNQVASIMAAKFLDSTGNGTTSAAINAIEFAIQAKAAFAASGGANVRVLSNSWGGGASSQSLLNEVNKANANDMLFVAAAGNASANNDVTPFYPANLNALNVVAVAATDSTDHLASFSNYGQNMVDLGAPGVSILSTIRGGGYAYFSGTSMATPHVSGAAALVLSACSLNTAALKSLLLTRVDPIAALSTVTMSGGRLDVASALYGCAAPNAPPTVALTSPAAGANFVAPATVALTATASDADGSVNSVTFYVNGAQVGIGTTSPYSASWNAAAAGTYSITAVATDNRGATTTSAPVSVTVSDPAVPVPSQTLLTTQVPVGQNLSDGTMWEMGMRLVSDVAGQTTALRFWKSSLDAGPHVGRLWSATGQVLGTVTFTNETASGWQQQTLATPVAIAANTEYVVTVTTGPGGYFVSTQGGFATALTSGHLQAPAGANGIFGSVGVFPTRTFNSSNYFRDIVFVAGAGTPDTAPPTVTVTQPAPGSVVSGSVMVAATAQDAVGVAGVQFQVDGVPLGGELPTAPYSITWDSTGATNGSHVVSARARDAAGNQATAAVTVTVSNAAAVPVPSQTLLTTQVPVGQNLSDGTMWEMGMRFVSDVAGQTTALRFWKSSLDAGPHVGRLWSAAGQVLATVTFSNETASGWQQQTLAAPVAMAANTEYVVTVTTGPGGYFVSTQGGFTTGLTSGHLQAPAGANGIFGSVGVFPTRTFNSSNYFRDIVFVAGAGTPDTAPPTVTVTQPAPGSVVSGSVMVAATAQDAVGVAGVQFQVDGVPLGGELPTAPYSITWDSTGATNGSHVVSARARDAAGNQATAAVTVTVSNAAAVPSQTLLTTQVPVGQNLSDGTMWEMGMRFVSDVAGQTTALRFWKSSLDAGPHVGRLWSATGQVLATVTFGNETASGWQQQTLAAPVAIAANTEYVVTVTTGPGGYFVSTQGGFATAVTNEHLQAPPGANGIFGSVGVFPTRTFNSSNYFRDIVFVAQ